jgi:N12 class adenine-specific DNA methylase
MMHIRKLIPIAAIATLVAAGASEPGFAKTVLSTTAARHQTVAVEALPRQENDERTTECVRAKDAYKRLYKVRDELTRLQLAFEPTDDIRPKLDAMITQTNDLMTTTRIRVDRCPPQR